MTLAPISRIPDRPTTAGMRGTAAQDREIATPTGWRHDRRVWLVAAGLLIALLIVALIGLMRGWSSSDATASTAGACWAGRRSRRSGGPPSKTSGWR